eukprot:XP_001704064.1 Hypothetical protein GL50803_19125 [Giardia lamblia ATCC 50803]
MQRASERSSTSVATSRRPASQSLQKSTQMTSIARTPGRWTQRGFPRRPGCAGRCSMQRRPASTIEWSRRTRRSRGADKSSNADATSCGTPSSWKRQRWPWAWISDPLRCPTRMNSKHCLHALY